MQDVTINAWLESLAAKTPTPGGGAVAALTAAIAAAQLGMVAAYTTGPKMQKLEEHMKSLGSELATLRTQALALVQEDAAAFSNVGRAYQLPKKTENEKTARQAAVQQALVGAALPPTKVTQLAVRLLDIAGELADNGNPSVLSDVVVGSCLARAAVEAAIVNIEINEQSIKEPKTKQKLQRFIQDAAQTLQQADYVKEAVKQRMNA